MSVFCTRFRLITALSVSVLCSVPLYGAGSEPCDSTSAGAGRPSRLGFSAEVRGAHVLDILSIYDNLLTSYDFASPVVTVSSNTFPSDSCYWARAFNFPAFYGGFSFSPYNVLGGREGCSLGDMYNLFGGASFKVIRTGCFSTGPFLEMGLAYATRIYDPVTNIRNVYVGAHLDGIVSFGWNFSWLVARHYEIFLGAGLTHHSIGRVVLPNRGVNEVEVSLGLRYHIDEPFMGNARDVPEVKPLYDKGLRWNIYAACGLHSCGTIWEAEGNLERTVPCVRALLGADATWRYHPIFSSGIGLNVQYTSGIDRLRQADAVLHPEECADARYCPVLVGADLLQQFHYRNFSFHVRLGTYLFRQQGVQEETTTGHFYQKLGLRYNFSSVPIFLGLDVKIHHFSTSDCLELSLGVDLGSKVRQKKEGD